MIVSCHNIERRALRAADGVGSGSGGVSEAADDLIVVARRTSVLLDLLADDRLEDRSKREALRRTARAAVQDWMEVPMPGDVAASSVKTALSIEVPATLEEALERAQDEAQTLDLRRNESGAERGKRKDRYLTYPKLLEQVRPVLLRNRLTWATFPTTLEENGLLKPALRYRLTFTPTRDIQEGTMLLAVKENTSQAQGSGITYARRYALQAVLDLAPDGDDDGQIASEAAPRPAPTDPEQPMTEEQVNAMHEAIAEQGWAVAKVYERIGFVLDRDGDPTIATGRAVKRLIDEAKAKAGDGS